MVTETLENLFNQYQAAFAGYQLSDVADCYHLPCTLSTPDNMVVVLQKQQLDQVLNEIFQQLKQAQTKEIKVLRASYTLVNDEIVLACVDWAFINAEQQIFADFSAFYHLIKEGNSYKIVSVSSQQLSQSVALTNVLNIS
ncbi:hypothetical protein tinsulaeT_34570 [Thalassotalea insulae]|uniref:Nuclear transport factor 2 family protein n=1 Tax=Thalassotalea insulae TaxID=2056778 RepID=A0ABQ6GZX6_9GAMM|nr:ketosteroid isomerase family protein [Thalassotalea insulae]GLX80117.1 hypothetical protein tinsulaeT_34570 [Thalassotalea insulae]